MTIGYLKEQLENYPDEARVVLDIGPWSHLKMDDCEVITIFGFKSPEHLKNCVMLQTRSDFDYMAELKEEIKHLRDVKKAKNWKEILLNQGFTEDEIKEVEHVSK